MMPDVPAGLAQCARSGNLLGAQRQDRFQRMHLNFVQYSLDRLAGAFDQIDDGEQDLSIAAAELLDDGGRLGERS
jgi:hypothetical protein